MMLRRAAIRPFRLPLTRPLDTAHGRISERMGWLVELEDEAGRCGFGEATPLPDFGTEDLASCRGALEAALSACIRGDAEDGPPVPVERADRRKAFPGIGVPCARFAFEAAQFDLAAKRAGRSLAGEIRDRAGEKGAPEASVAVQALVGGEDPASVEQRARELTAVGFGAFKLKLAVSRNARDLGLDLERVSALRSVVGPEARLRLDANEAWNRDAAATALIALEKFGIDYVEQPVRREDLVGLKWLSTNGAIPVAADEALLGDGLANCLEARAASILIVKPAAIGGVSDSIAIWRRAREQGLRVVWSSLIDGAVGRAAPLALAAGLGPADEVHGLGTAGLFAKDLAAASDLGRLDRRGRMPVSPEPGIGFEPEIPVVTPRRGSHAKRHAGQGGTRSAERSSHPLADRVGADGEIAGSGARHDQTPVFEVVA